MGNFYEILERECSSKVRQYLKELTCGNAKTYETYFNFVPTTDTANSNIGFRNINYNCASTDEQAENYN